MPLQRITAPAKEPISVADVKSWAVIDVEDDDALISAMIKAARAFAEKQLRRSLITQTWMLTLDSFPGPSLMGVPYGLSYSIPGHAIVLERSPVQSITSIQYLDMSGTLQTMPTANWVDPTLGGAQRCDDFPRITPVFGQIWPINLPQIGSVRVTYVAGYGPDGSYVPEDIITWMKMRVATLYSNREEVVVGTRIVVAELPYVDSLLDSDTVNVV
jgi:uncharacterized phiE125 gp8 family phage protein